MNLADLIPPQWAELTDRLVKTDSFRCLSEFVTSEYGRKPVYPSADRIFRALELTPPQSVKAVMLGQDPYHGPGQAHGLCFSVPEGVRPPPSLKNIFRELANDLGHPLPANGNLEPWARQGVLLLNAVLTVRDGQPGAHAGIGWEDFTDGLIGTLSRTANDPLVFILWGRHAARKQALIDTSKHLVIRSPHPSPLSAHRGFFGSHPFSRTNEFLSSKGGRPVDWSLPCPANLGLA